jgi:hypothetical protein
VTLDGAHGDHQAASDLLVREVLAEQPQDLVLPRRDHPNGHDPQCAVP